MNKPIVIFGSGEIAALAKQYFSADSDHEVVGFTVDDEYCNAESYEGLPLVPFSQITSRFPPKEVSGHVAVSYKRLNRLREEKYHQMKDAGYQLASYVSTHSAVWESVEMGDNCFILENQTIQLGCEIGNNVMMWSGNHIGHGTKVCDHAYISSHVVVAGHCCIGERSFLGVNATIKDFTTVGSDVFVAMSASVVTDLPDGSAILPVKSEVLKPDDRKTKSIRRHYFGC